MLRERGRPLSELIATVEAVDDAAPAVARALGIAGERLVRGCFDTSTAPDGAKWAPLKHPRPGKGPLVRKGDMRLASPHAILGPSGFLMVTEGMKALHQEGFATLTRWLPARPFYPDGPLSPSWEKALNDAALDALKRRLP